MLFDQIYRELELTERHLIVLRKVIEEGPIGILKLSDETGMPTHKVRYSLRVLEQEHLIRPSSHGAVAGENTEKFLEDFDGQISAIIAKASHIQQIRNSI
jgi:predicted transcriptional regulator